MNTPTRRTGPGTRDLNTPSIRSALLAESYVKSAAAAFPLGRPFQRANQIRQVMPGQQGSCPPGFYGGKPGKARQRINCRALQARCIAPPRPHRKSVHFSSIKFTKANWRAAPGPLPPPPPHPQAQHPPHPVQDVTLGQLAPGIVLGYPHSPGQLAGLQAGRQSPVVQVQSRR